MSKKYYHVYWITRNSTTWLKSSRNLLQACKFAIDFIEKQRNANWKLVQYRNQDILPPLLNGEYVIGWFMPKSTRQIEEVVVQESDSPEALFYSPKLKSEWQHQATDSRALQFSDQNGGYKILISQVGEGSVIAFLANYYQRLRWKGDQQLECDIIQFKGAREREVLQQCMDWLEANAEPATLTEGTFKANPLMADAFAYQ